MSLISFYPGPSRVYSYVTEFIYDAYKDGILSVNHRSPEFMKLMEDTKKTLRSGLKIPEDYEIMFVSSATECWEIIAQSLTKKKSQHFYNGAFGEKWANFAELAGKEVVKVEYGINEPLPTEKLDDSAELICLTQNETSNGSRVPQEVITRINSLKSDHQLIAVDATSSMAGVYLDFTLADIWFASVQKCFGLPSGLAVLICSPYAIEKAEKLKETNHYNSFLRILENHRNNQTHYTPNTLDIYLLHRTGQISKGIEYIDEKIRKRYENWTSIIDQFDSFDWLISEEDLRSRTVFTLKCNDPELVKTKAREVSIVLGNGYGTWKDKTFRIANFPAIKGKEIDKLVKFLKKNFD